MGGTCCNGAEKQETALSPSPDHGVADDEAYDEAEDKRRQELMKKKGNQRRAGVAAESVSNDRIQNYVKKNFPKPDSAKKTIKETLKTNDKLAVLFGHLDGSALDDVVNAFQIVKFSEGQDIIRQGEEGDRLYICADGNVDVFVRRPGMDATSRGDKVVSLGAGALFGELALMYQAPRAATVQIASKSCNCYALDREDFKMLLAQSGKQKMEMYEGFLSQVEILKSLNNFELAKLSEALDSNLYDAGEEIIKQGDSGTNFFIVEDGTAAAYISGASGEVEVKQYATGSYFGEIALLNAEPRKATVKATGEGASVLTCSKEDFENLLGPIKDILKKEIGKYSQYEKFLK